MYITVFGKTGCRKCEMLIKRLEGILKKREDKKWKLEYKNLTNEDDLVEFCKLEVLNPQRIPAIVMYGSDNKPLRYSGAYSESKDGDVFLPVYLGASTDYDTGRGVLTEDTLFQLMEVAVNIS